MKAIVAIVCMAFLLAAADGQTSKPKATSATKGKTPATATESAKAKGGSAKKKKLPEPAASKPAAKEPALDKPPQDNAGEPPTRLDPIVGPNITLNPEELANFAKNSKAVQRLLKNALELTRQELTYRYGSSDPSTGGMDCSGTMYFLLKSAGIKDPPRDSSGLYLWAEKAGTLRRVSPSSLKDPALADMRPGDLLFWEGTYEVQRDPPISHTMIYLGREKKTGQPVVVGASDGRTYDGVRRSGVSVFDFKLPRPESSAKFVAYARIPGLGSASRKRDGN